jgi:signal transduction histidine kinase
MVKVKIAFLVFFLSWHIAHALEKKDVIGKVNRLELLNDSELKDSVEAILNNLFEFEKPFGKSQVDEIKKKIKGRNKNAMLMCLATYPEFVTENKMKYLDEAYRFAVENGLDDYRASYYLSKSQIFREEEVFDSSMIYILKARNIAQNSDPEFFATTLHQLGDIYFSVGLYDNAEKYYNMVDSVKGAPFFWEGWRKAVIRNNKGLIEIERKNYDKALSLFTQSLNEIPDTIASYADSLKRCYDQRMIAYILLLKGNYAEAKENIIFPFEFAYRHQLNDQLVGIYRTLITLSIETGDKVSAEKYFHLFDEFYKQNQAPTNIKPEHALLSAKVYDFLGDKEKAVNYYKKYIRANDSLIVQKKTAGIVQLVTEYNYNHLEENIHQIESQRVYLLGIIAMLLFLSVIIAVWSRKIFMLNKLLAETNQTKDKLFSIVSHDLKSPFNSLLGFSELLQENLQEEDLEQAKLAGKVIYEKSEEVYQLIVNLLDWSRSQQNGLTLMIEKLDISKSISDIIQLYSAQAQLKNITVESDIEKETWIMADKPCITTIFSNLLSNAIKFTPTSGHIRFNAHLSKKFVEIQVSDTGVGIDPEQMKKLFDLLQSTTTEGTNHEKGTGLGLLIAKEFVEKNGGSISVFSQKGKGSTFTVKLILA